MIEEAKAPTRKPHSAALQVIYGRPEAAPALGKPGGGREALWLGAGILWICLALATAAPANTEITSFLLPPPPAKARCESPLL